MTTDEVGTLTDHSAALGRLRTQSAKIRYVLDHCLPRDCTVEDVRRWLHKHGQPVPSSSHTRTIVNEWRASNRMSDTNGNVLLTPELIAELDRAETPSPEPAAEPAKPAGAKGFYAVALMSIGVSVDTSWRFFEQRLGITDVVERVVLFSVMEAALVACGWAMRGGVRQNGRPGPARLVAWALTAFAAFAAFSLSGPVAGTARVLLGPVLGLVMLHLALGIEIRASRQRTTTWARVGRELRERVLSLLGLGDDGRDALARTRDKAALRAAKLAIASPWTPRRKARLRKALHASHVAHDPVQRDRMLRELGVLQHADELAKITQPSPW
ncbi:hypothetical protein SAMN04488074_101668 [Lentzea albidocapillata subsp. violacea]|uniref:Uncharacterized protein n=1 Tax=Lentzea albidocapillata subsp. violacea TaxID=128104 RepID=A0A1G8RGS4_9PSEU|nr:hypothetical protein [Lentzea albidocapillata]SDJ16063.1 hypothetical protein SAMN04488074_101668 [Lentzea albidocapillata subsp. violacea]